MTPTLHIRLLGDFLLMSGDAPMTTINSRSVTFRRSLLAICGKCKQGILRGYPAFPKSCNLLPDGLD